MKSNEKMDNLLKDVFSPSVEPDNALNENILRSIKEKKIMKIGKRVNLRRVVTIAAALVLMLSVTAFATIKLLSANDVIDKTDNKKLSEAYKAENKQDINETKTCGDFTITYMGILSGKDITDHIVKSDGIEKTDRTYAVVAIRNKDNTPIPKMSDDAFNEKYDFFVSPFIQGLDPNKYNIMTMDGGYEQIVEDGVLYRIIDCNNIEAFADKQIYLAVQSGSFPDDKAYSFDESTGQIKETKDYNGVNILYKLSIDKSKANPEKAKQCIEDMNK